MPQPKKIFFIAGENSGDQPGSEVIRCIRSLQPDWIIEGLGGPLMEAAGMRLLRNMVNDLAIVGLVEVITKAPRIYQVYQMVKERLTHERPDLVVLIDYPGFNLKLVAPLAKSLGIPVIYYIMPQIWAWDYARIKKLKAYCERIIPIYPFEEKMLRQEGIDAQYLGNPKLDLLTSHVTMSREEVFSRFGFDPAKKLIGMLPGSRKNEVRAILPIMLEGAQRLLETRQDLQFVLLRSGSIPLDLIDTYLDQYDVPMTVLDAQPGKDEDISYSVRAALDFSWVKSGTSTLEAALLGVPFVIIYKVNYFSFWIASKIVSIPFIGLPNIIAGNLVVPELLQDQATGQNLADQTRHYLGSEAAYAQMREQLFKLREMFGPTGSAERVAEAIVGFLG